MSRGEIAVRVLPGLVPYDDGRALQLEAVAARRAGTAPDTLYLLEHAPVVTLGRNASEAGVVAAPGALAAAGIELRRTERGGQATYHGPGQIVGYPIVGLRGLGVGVAGYVRGLEETMIRAAAAFGVAAGRREGIVGVFADAGRGPKIGAIGVRVSAGIAFHGFAFNVAPELSHYRFIVPCGMTAIGVASLASILGAPPPLDAARDALIAAFAEVFDLEPIADDPR
jgi:lipoyl(octanoyl) transferase